jgi:hypothetical protein
MKPRQGESWVKHNWIIDEVFERENVGLPSFEVSGKKVGDLHCFQRIAG